MVFLLYIYGQTRLHYPARLRAGVIRECGSTLYVGLIGTFQMLIQKSTRIDTPFFNFGCFFFLLLGVKTSENM